MSALTACGHPTSREAEKDAAQALRRKHISAWLWRLSRLTRFPNSDEPTRAATLADFAEGLTLSDLPIAAFSKASLFAVAGRHEWFPAFKPLRDQVGENWRGAQYLPGVEKSRGRAYRTLTSEEKAWVDVWERNEARGWLHDDEHAIDARCQARRRGLWMNLMQARFPRAAAFVARVSRG
ncbi:hypothetical protein CGLAMM_07335 [Acetobacteraceae bacterium EV16G]|uniref:Uncharacterized protein n=1 Tax=Sorlinia euscelidii TaxID=3081148 RepID=A0ABU7U1W6_9PROT